MNCKDTPIFNPVSRYLIENWSRLERLTKAVDDAKDECKQLLRLLKEKIKGLKWWDELTWEVSPDKPKEAYFYKKSWMVNGETVVWIGIEEFSLQSLLGENPNTGIYVWTPLGKDSEILTRAFVRGFLKVKNRYYDKGYKESTGKYMLYKKVWKLSPPDILEGKVIDNFLQELTFLAELEPVIDTAVEEYKATIEKK